MKGPNGGAKIEEGERVEWTVGSGWGRASTSRTAPTWLLQPITVGYTE